MRPAPGPPGTGPRADALVTDCAGHRAGHHHRRLRARVVLRSGRRGGRRRACGMARRGGRGAGGDHRRHASARRRERLPPPSDPASARHPTKSAPICATRCWRAIRPTTAFSRPAAARPAGSSIFPAIAPRGWPLPAYVLSPPSHADTAVDEARFFSYRRRTLGGGGPIGHQISIISLDP